MPFSSLARMPSEAVFSARPLASRSVSSHTMPVIWEVGTLNRPVFTFSRVENSLAMS